MSDSPVKRRHHYLPRFFLRGFLAPGQTHLHVRDLVEGRAWRSTPDDAGHQRDLFRPTENFPHPNYFEDAFAEVEGQLASSLGRVIEAEVIERELDLARLLHVVALNIARPPAEMRDFEDVLDTMGRAALVESVTPEIHARTIARMQADGIDTDLVEDVEAWKARLSDGSLRLELTHDARLTFGVVERASDILKILFDRRWSLLRAPEGESFICSDRPVHLLNNRNGVEEAMPRFDDPRFDVVMPLSRRLALVGGHENRGGAVDVEPGAVVFVNHIGRAGADRFLFAASSIAVDELLPSQEDASAFRRAVYPSGQAPVSR